jgi:hypothetical protein
MGRLVHAGLAFHQATQFSDGFEQPDPFKQGKQFRHGEGRLLEIAVKLVQGIDHFGRLGRLGFQEPADKQVAWANA